MLVTITLSVSPDPAQAGTIDLVQANAATEVSPVPAMPPLFPPQSSGAHFPLPISTRQIALETGKTLVVTGPNGVGKSALLAEIGREISKKEVHVETFFGNRHIQFGSDDIDQVGQSLEQLQSQLRHAVTRFRHPYGEQHLKSVVRRIGNLQAQATYEVIKAQEAGASFEEARAAQPLILPAINGIFEAARLPIQVVLTGGGLRAKRGAAEYGIDRMSDGERAALLLVGAALIQPPESFILVDEPERHLNPAISGALLAALIRARSDLGFVFASHDLALLDWLRPDKIVHLRDSFVMRSDPEDRRYDLSVLTDQEGIPEDLRFAILGSRRLLLLVEGEISSEDKALYSHIYPDWNVVARGGWETVATGVRALRGNHAYHWLHAAGIIDRDGRDAVEQSRMAAERIFCLPVPTIENLFLHPDLLQVMADRIHELKGGPSGAERFAQLRAELPELLRANKEEVLIRQVVWEANRRNSEQKVSPRSIRDGQSEIAPIDLSAIRSRFEAEFDAAASGADSMAILMEIPVKNTGIPAKVATVLGFNGFKDYTRSVLQQIEIASPSGRAILETLRAAMPVLREPGEV